MKPTKTEIKTAYRNLEDQKELAEEIRRTEGNREANASMAYPDAARRCSRAIQTLKLAQQPLPTWLTMNWSYYRTLGWHNDYCLPA